MVILVTGSSGFTGEVLIPKLKTNGYEVIGIDYKEGQYTTKIVDISKPVIIEEPIDIVIHLAAKLEHNRCSSKEYYETNVVGTKNILDVALKNNAYFIYISTTAIYGSPNSPISEKTKISPMGEYAKTKWIGEKQCMEYSLKGLNVSIVRPSVLIGKKRLGIYKLIFKNLFNNSPVTILGDGKNKISFVNIEDFCEFLLYLVKRKNDKIIVNFGGKVPGTLDFIINELRLHVKSKSKIQHIPIQFLGILKILSRLKIIPVTSWQLSVMHKDYFYDDKFLLSTGFNYKHEAIDALKEMANYYRSNFLRKN